MDQLKQAARRRFRNALWKLQNRTGWNAKQIAANFQLPYRTVANWLAGKSSPGERRLRSLCRVFGWEYEILFGREALADQLFVSQYCDVEALTRRFLSLRVRDPLEAWSFIPMAGALVFNELSASGFECRAITDHNFGVRVEFKLPALRKVFLQVGVVSGRGLIIRWLNEQGLQERELDLSDSALEAIKRDLLPLAGFERTGKHAEQ